MTGEGAATFSDALGNVLFEAGGTISGQRITLEP
jgi:hypothetical protein